MKDTNARITRWYLALQPFKFKVVHRPGVPMAVADFSRNVLPAAGRRAHRPERGGGGMWRGWRGKAERAKGRAGSETSGSEQMLTQSERANGEEERESHEEESRVYILVKVLFCVIKHPFWLVTPDFLVLPSLIPEPCYNQILTR